MMFSDAILFFQFLQRNRLTFKIGLEPNQTQPFPIALQTWVRILLATGFSTFTLDIQT
jgi:hypothetical protein